jgi:mannosyl-glycoprotein endo-beta-N-acetylglucosaminidase
VKVKPRRANLRDAARGRIIAKVSAGALFSVLREEGDWLEVEGEGKKGWLARQVVVAVPAPVAATALPSKAAPTAPTPPAAPSGLGSGSVKWTTLNLRAEPDGDVIAKLQSGAKLRILSIEPGWLRVAAPDGKQGWVVDRAVARDGVAVPPAPVAEVPAPPAATQAQAAVKWPKLNLRAAPKTGKVIATLERGARLALLGREGSWLKVRSGDHEGWVAAKAVEGPAPAAVSPAPAPAAGGKPSAAGPLRQVVWTTVNLREEPSARSKVADKLARGTRLRELGAEGGWVKVQTLEGERVGWVTRQSIK